MSINLNHANNSISTNNNSLIVTGSGSTSNTTGALTVSGGLGVTGNIFVGGTSAGPTGVYTDILRYSANGQPWSFGGGGGFFDICNCYYKYNSKRE